MSSRVYASAAPPASRSSHWIRQMSAPHPLDGQNMPKRSPEPEPSSDEQDVEEEDSDFADESIPGNDEDQEDEDEDSDHDEDAAEKEIVVDFEAFPPDESDFQGIKKLLQQLFLREDVNTSELANLLISKPDVTTILKQVNDDDDDDEAPDDDEDEDVYGIFSLIDLKSNSKSAPGIESLRKLLSDKAKGQDQKFADAAGQALSSKSALILNERFINLPARISLPCFEALAQDVKKKTPDYDFDHFFMIIKVQKAISKKKSSQKNGSKRQKVDSSESCSSSDPAEADDASGTLFQNPEEEILFEKSVHWMEFSVANQCDDDVRSGNWDEEDVKYCPCRRILLLDRQRFLTAISQLQHEFSGPAS